MDKLLISPSSSRAVSYTAYCGLFAFSLIIGGAILSAWFYSGRTHESYSFFNHFISELGNKTYSGHAYFFNGGMLLAGIPIMIFMYGISTLLRSRIRHAFLMTGMLSGILCIALGYYSSDQLDIHLKVALGQFNAMLLSSMLFSAAVLRERDGGHFAQWLGYAGAIPILCIILFLSIEYTHHQDMVSGHDHLLLYHRPDFWLLPFSEWLVFFSLIVWIATICGYLIVCDNRQ